MDVVSDERTQHKGKRPNGATASYESITPYTVEVQLEGTETMLVHRYDVEDNNRKAKAPKGSQEKKEDNPEAYVYRLPNGECGIPGLMLKAAICEASKFRQDPRSPRKSMRDLMRAAIRIPGMASFGKAEWDYLDKRKVNVQRNGVVRVRPAFAAGWKLTFRIEVLLPEYVNSGLLNALVVDAGRLCGLGDYRPDFGTFMVTTFKVL